MKDEDHYQNVLVNLTDGKLHQHFLRTYFFNPDESNAFPLFEFQGNYKTSCKRYINIPTNVIEPVYLNNAYHLFIDTLLPIITFSKSNPQKPLIFISTANSEPTSSLLQVFNIFLSSLI